MFIQGTEITSYYHQSVHQNLGPYRVVRPIDKGEKGELFLVESQEGEQFALKRFYSKEEFLRHLPKEYVDCLFDENGVYKLAYFEYEKGQRLSSDNIVKTYKVITEKDFSGKMQTYLLLEYVPGQTFDKVQRGAFSIQEASKYILQLIDALREGFLKGYIHNDLYSQNIMIDERGSLKLIDVDSFDEIQDDDRTHLEYLNGIFSNFEMIYMKSDAFSLQIDELMRSLRAVADKYSSMDSSLICPSSPSRYFIPILEEMAGIVGASCRTRALLGSLQD